MSDDRMTLDALLAKQAEPPPLLVTIEPIADSPDHVKVTPFNADAGCACAASLRMPKQIVEWVRPTGAIHSCCGKRLSVVEIGLTDSVWTDVLQQLSTQSAARSTPARPGRMAGLSAFIGNEGISTPEEGQTGFFSDLVCTIRRKNCLDNVKSSVGEDRLIKECRCWEDYYQCRNPLYQPIDCAQAVGGPA